MPLPLIAALIGGATSLIGAGMQARAARRAAETQADVQRENIEYSREQTEAGMADFDAALQDALGYIQGGQTSASQYQQPFYDTGVNALSAYANALGLNGPGGNQAAVDQFQTSPGYDFALSQGVGAIDRSAASRGGLYSGATGKALSEYGIGLANQEYGNWLSRLAGTAGMGQAAGNNLSQIAANTSGMSANALLGTAANKSNLRTGNLSNYINANTSLGLAQASGDINAANAWNAGLTNLTTLLGYGAGEGFSMPGLQNIDASRFPTLSQFAMRFAA